MAASTSPTPPTNRTPGERIAAECAVGGGAALIAGCVALLNGRPDEVGDRLITILGGPAAAHVLAGGEGGRSGHWPRVWAARGLLHALDHHPADADPALQTAAATPATARTRATNAPWVLVVVATP